MSKIFISYKRVDRDTVFPIVDKIKQETGSDCWIDLEGIESGDQFQNVIIDAIDKADTVVFMLSKNFIAPYKDEKTGEVDLRKQTFPEKEIMYALRHNKRLVPLSIDGTQVYDCKWLEFNCGSLDCIDWAKREQREKFFHNMKQWNGEPVDLNFTADENPNEINVDTDDSNKPVSRTRKFNKRRWAISLTSAFALCLVAFSVWFYVHKVHSSTQTVVQQEDNSSIPNCIDLGLTSGTLWADRNLGAKNEKDSGNLYSWGEVKAKRDYGEVKYKSINQTKIEGMDQYDAARSALGGGWMLPSKKQFDELISECTWKWSGNGYKVTSKKNGNSIFLPATGYSRSSIHELGSQGFYWTGDKGTSKWGYELFFSKNEHKTGQGYLYYGRTIRPVKKK